MLLLIDGYNLLKATMPPGLAGLDELGLCRALDRSGLSQGHVTVVFDGSYKPGLLAASPVDGVELVYAGRGRSADEVIFGLIQQHTYPARLTVVSSDHEIQRAAKRRRARAIDSKTFIHELLLTLRHAVNRSQNDKGQAIAPLASDDWARLFGVDPSAPIVPPARHSNKTKK